MGVKIYDKGFNEWIDKGTKIRKSTYETIGGHVKSDLADRYKNEQDPSGKSWKPLSKKTLARRKKQGKGAKILKDTGHMLGASFVTKATDTHVSIGFTAPYALFHEKGLGVPQRRLLPKSKKELPMKAIKNTIKEAMR